jgi:hypothetical protein
MPKATPKATANRHQRMMEKRSRRAYPQSGNGETSTATEDRMTGSGWRDVATFSSGFEADLAIAQLEAAGIHAVRDNNDTVGIFGPGFQGATARGVTVRVPAEALGQARAVLRPVA